MAAYQPRALLQCCAIETREAQQFMEEARVKKSPDSATSPAVQGTIVPTEIALYDNDWKVTSGESYLKSLKMSEDSRTTRLYCNCCWTLLMVEAPWFGAEAAISESMGMDKHTFNVTGVYSAMHASHEIDGEVKSTVLDPMIESTEHQARLCESEWTGDLGPLPTKEHEYASFENTYMLGTCLVNADLRTFLREYTAPEVRTPLEGATMSALASKAGTDVDDSLDPQEFLERAAAKRAESLEKFKAKQQEQLALNATESLNDSKSIPGSPEAELDERKQRILAAQRKKEQDELRQKRKDELAEIERIETAKRLAEQQKEADEAKRQKRHEDIRRAKEKAEMEKAAAVPKKTEEGNAASCSVQ